MKLFAAFDVNVHDDTVVPIQQGIEFVRGLLRLLEDNEDFFIILKKKYPAEKYAQSSMQYNDTLTSYHKLEKHPRCYSMTQQWASTSEIIAISDLVISLTFTSLTIEALCIRKKAIYYDPLDCFRDTYYDTVPGLVCHGYDELKNRVNALLKMPKDEYNSYLDRYVKGELEHYLDGMAITRFRKHLSTVHL
jgi:polysaccharide biosynthesis PFTS motif protein